MKKFIKALGATTAIIISIILMGVATWIPVVAVVKFCAFCFGASVTILQATGIWTILVSVLLIITFIRACFE